MVDSAFFWGWWNVVYLLPLAVALLYMILYIVTGLGELDVDLDPDVDLDAGIEADADLEAEASFQAEADAEGDVHGDAAAGSASAGSAASVVHLGDVTGQPHQFARGTPRPRRLLRLAVWVGVGHLPFSLLILVLVCSWSILGIVCNILLATEGAFAETFSASPQWLFWVSLPLATVGSMWLTHLISHHLGPYLPRSDSSIKRKQEFVGGEGQALYDITDEFGLLAFRDHEGTLHQLPVRVQPGSGSLTKGSACRIIGYDSSSRLYWVTASEAVVPAEGNLSVEPSASAGQNERAEDPNG